jgi:hypothetical protein
VKSFGKTKVDQAGGLGKPGGGVAVNYYYYTTTINGGDRIWVRSTPVRTGRAAVAAGLPAVANGVA